MASIWVLASACTGGASPSAGDRPSPSPSGSGEGEPAAFLPAPDEPIPRDPVRLAERLSTSMVALYDAIDRWTAEGDTSSWPPPEEVVLHALFEQRVFRELARDPRLAEAVPARLPPRFAAEARANAEAGAALFSVVRRITGPVTLRTRRPEPAGVLLAYFIEAENRFGVDWEVLAAVALIESRFGRVTSRSSAGAQGPMQFLPSTWEAYGLGGDVHDPHDAIIGAANYLGSSGAPEDYPEALYRYNPVRAYVVAVLRYARQMMHDPRSYYAYYNWQVFVRTRHGDVRLTGPGA